MARAADTRYAGADDEHVERLGPGCGGTFQLK
jgi:hypothetical protein